MPMPPPESRPHNPRTRELACSKEQFAARQQNGNHAIIVSLRKKLMRIKHPAPQDSLFPHGEFSMLRPLLLVVAMATSLTACEKFPGKGDKKDATAAPA